MGTDWVSEPVRMAGVLDGHIHPGLCLARSGALTTLADGRILLNWACYRDADGKPWREPQFSLSGLPPETIWWA